MMQPTHVHDGLAMYRRGTGEPVLLMPYPHAMTLVGMAESPFAETLTRIGRSVITFDPPGAYASTRQAQCTLSEMLTCAAETLNRFEIGTAVDIAGHSMGAFCALAFALEHPGWVRSMVLTGALSGFPAVRRWSVPHNWRCCRDREWWRAVYLGTRVMLGYDNMAVHKKLSNLVAQASYVDPSFAPHMEIEKGDRRRPAPPRTAWQRNVRRYDLAQRLRALRIPALLLYGRQDVQTPLPMAEELRDLLPAVRLVLFDRSGHSPFVEEPEAFEGAVRQFVESSQ